MNKEKEIIEIATVDSVCEKAGADCKTCAKKCVHYYRAIDLYNAGYRKADEVRKETAKDIVERILTASGIDILAQEYRLPVKVLNEIKRKYGVEVEE